MQERERESIDESTEREGIVGEPREDESREERKEIEGSVRGVFEFSRLPALALNVSRFFTPSKQVRNSAC